MFSRKRKMLQKTAVNVPQVESQMSQRDEEPQTHRAEPSSQGRRDKLKRKRGNDSEKEKFLLKVKLPKPLKQTLSGTDQKRGGEKPKGWMVEPTENNTKNTVSRGGRQSAGGTQSDCTGDIFFFSEGLPINAKNDKEKAKLTVLRTIAKMLEENQLIRQRVDALSQTNRGCTD